MKLIIAEKPSVAASIAKVLGADQKRNGYYESDEYIVSWCVGHLVEMVNAESYDTRYKKWSYGDLPIAPDDWQYQVSKDKDKQFQILKKLMDDSRVKSLVCATDAGREGELIFRLVYYHAQCKKPFERLWISSMEDVAIKDGFLNLKDGRQYDNLYQSALCRSKADWLVGINATRLFSILYGATLNVGRVQSPTLAMLVEREKKIRNFQKEKYYQVHIYPNNIDAVSEKISTEAAAMQMETACQKGQAVVVSVEKEEKNIAAPRLYDLTTLQREANRFFGYTAQQTLDYAQSLYEKKLLTYPRTDSQFLTEDMAGSTVDLIQTICSRIPFAKGLQTEPEVSKVIDNSKVSDHHAIIPTMQSAKEFENIPKPDQNILFLVVQRLLSAAADKHIFEVNKAIFDCGGYSFTARAKHIVREGWKEIEKQFRSHLTLSKDTQEQENDAEETTISFSENQTFDSVNVNVSEHYTSPPKAHTEDTLLSAMENASSDGVEVSKDAEKKGLGTPATRAAIIEKLVSSGMMERSKKQLIPTPKAIALIDILPEEVISPKLTAQWENALTDIAKGALDPNRFIQDIERLTANLVQTHTEPLENKKDLFREKREDKEVIGICPRCGENIVEGKTNFYCENRDCSFAMWKDNLFFSSKKKTLSKKIAQAMLEHGEIAMTGLYSEKTGKSYDAIVQLNDSGDKYVNYKLVFQKEK